MKNEYKIHPYQLRRHLFLLGMIGVGISNFSFCLLSILFGSKSVVEDVVKILISVLLFSFYFVLKGLRKRTEQIDSSYHRKQLFEKNNKIRRIIWLIGVTILILSIVLLICLFSQLESSNLILKSLILLIIVVQCIQIVSLAIQKWNQKRVEYLHEIAKKARNDRYKKYLSAYPNSLEGVHINLKIIDTEKDSKKNNPDM